MGGGITGWSTLMVMGLLAAGKGSMGNGATRRHTESALATKIFDLSVIYCKNSKKKKERERKHKGKKELWILSTGSEEIN